MTINPRPIIWTLSSWVTGSADPTIYKTTVNLRQTELIKSTIVTVQGSRFNVTTSINRSLTVYWNDKLPKNCTFHGDRSRQATKVETFWRSRRPRQTREMSRENGMDGHLRREAFLRTVICSHHVYRVGKKRTV